VKRSQLLVVALMLVAVWAQATYVVILRNGSRIVARDKYEVKGPNAIVTLKNGALMAIPMNQINLPATEKFNQQHLGDAVPLDWVDAGVVQSTPTPTPSVASLGRIRPDEIRPLADANQPTPTPGITFHDKPYRDRQVDQAFQEGLENSHLYLYRTSQGTDPKFLFVEVQVNGQPEVLKALQAIAGTYDVVAKQAPDRAPEKVEIRMLNESGKEAGVFRIGVADAAELAGGKVTPQEFYVQHVIF
jgi:hypothetical protein